MEISNNTAKPEKNIMTNGRSIFLGCLLLAVGVIWLLDNLNVIPECVLDVVLSWQMFLIVIGGFLISARSQVPGMIIAAVGVTFLVIDLLGVYVSLGKVIIPVLLIAAGAIILISNTKCRKCK